jgi:hypothetical protein
MRKYGKERKVEKLTEQIQGRGLIISLKIENNSTQNREFILTVLLILFFALHIYKIFIFIYMKNFYIVVLIKKHVLCAI